MIPLLRLMDDVGIVEHSIGSVPDPAQGHCTDDAGRALGLAAMLPKDLASPEIALRCLAQLQRSLLAPGRFALRLDDRGVPTDDPESDDATARALWGLSLASTSELSAQTKDWAFELLRQFSGFQSPFPRAAAHAVIAGSTLLGSNPTEEIGEQLLLRNIQFMPRRPISRSWNWPEFALSYGNALLPESLIHAGRSLENEHLLADGLQQLEWLIGRETSPAGHFSFTPVGSGSENTLSMFDQQPLEAWTTAAACSAALSIDANDLWADAITRCADWFAGRNDGDIPMWDHENGAAFDGLTVTGVNENEGAESSLALIGTLLELNRLEISENPKVDSDGPDSGVTYAWND